MSTKITKKIVINSPEANVVFDGLDFTEEATVEITAAASVTFRNCRFYNVLLDTTTEVPLIGNVHHMPNAAGYKLVIENCYFGKTGTYNMVNVGQTMYDGSAFINNYCKNDCANDDRFACYMAVPGAVYNFNGNYFENYSHNGLQFSFHGDAEVTVNVNDNHIGLPAEDLEVENRGLVRFRPNPVKTTSFEHITINANGNVFEGEEDRVAFCQFKDRDIVLTEENVPTYILNGIMTPLEIVDARTTVE